MSRADPVLTPTGVRLVLAALEAPLPRLSPAVMRQWPKDTGRLIATGVLQSAGHEAITTADDDFSDTPASLSWDADRGGFGYFSEADGWRSVETKMVTPYLIDIKTFLAALSTALELNGNVEEFVTAHIWQLGLVRLGSRPKRTPLLFGRRLNRAETWRDFARLVRDRPSPERRMLLTSTPSNLIPDDTCDCIVVSVLDALSSAAGLALNPAILALRYNHMPAMRPDSALEVLRNGAEVQLLGQTYRFTGRQQQKIILYMFDKYRKGQRWTSSSEIAVEVELGDSTRVRDVFKKNKFWGVVLTERDGQCGFCLPE